MLEAAGPNADQIVYWNALAGASWVAMQARLDRQIEPLGLAATEALAPAPGERLIDIGCGCGQTTLELARRVAPSGEALGVDPSGPMLAVAAGRAADAGLAQARFLQADAQTHPFEAASFDGAFSRFGVMFFADPVAAFANIRRALKSGGRLAFVCWRGMAENPIMTLPVMAAAPLLPQPPAPPPPNAPGPFGLADRGRIEAILSGAGFVDIAIAAHDQLLTAGDVDEATENALRIGPLGGILREHPELKEKLEPAVRAALAAHHTAKGVLLASATWMVTARNP
jgi:SAM-dependent methyltransferase